MTITLTETEVGSIAIDAVEQAVAPKSNGRHAEPINLRAFIREENGARDKRILEEMRAMKAELLAQISTIVKAVS